ncbi:GPI alpha-1,6-mannosyltransferase 2 isoform X5 [Opisthocomus hoazin]|uniref:GPI alpha-1,6-mannosyltransferase 2 isoform X5 n=1 Tax=Opisthocomus hoazin TaxID=30419 RepID=UPI003F52D3E0
MEPWGRPDPHLREVVWFAVRCRALTLLLQVLTRFLGCSSPVPYWFSAHLLQEHEPLLRSEGTDDQTRSGDSPLCKPPASHGKGTPGNPVVRLLLSRRAMAPLSRCVLGFFLSYWLLGLVLHCNFLPWT